MEPHHQLVSDSLINRVEPLTIGHGVKSAPACNAPSSSKTRRHWFTGTVPHHTNGAMNVLNLVEGDEAIVESPEGRFDPFIVHYAEIVLSFRRSAATRSARMALLARIAQRSKPFCLGKTHGEDAIREDG